MKSAAVVAQAIELRKGDKPEEALEILSAFLRKHPKDPDANYQMAWTYDSMGRESEAVSFYETALFNGLEDREGALLGLGSTYRCLGDYTQSLAVFDQAIAEFPRNRAFKVFRAVSLYNLGRAGESVGDLLVQLLDTTNDEKIKSYERALRFYADNLDEVWS